MSSFLWQSFRGKRLVSENAERRLCFCKAVICHVKFAVIKFDRLLFLFFQQTILLLKISQMPSVHSLPHMLCHASFETLST